LHHTLTAHIEPPLQFVSEFNQVTKVKKQRPIIGPLYFYPQVSFHFILAGVQLLSGSAHADLTFFEDIRP
jgi:hypothetical protein